MAISDANAATINKMNVAAQRVSLGTAFQSAQTDIAALEAVNLITSGSTLVTATHANASAVVIYTGPSTISGYIMNIFRAGSALSTDQYVSVSSGSLTIGPATYVVTANDKIMWMVY